MFPNAKRSDHNAPSPAQRSAIPLRTLVGGPSEAAGAGRLRFDGRAGTTADAVEARAGNPPVEPRAARPAVEPRAGSLVGAAAATATANPDPDDAVALGPLGPLFRSRRYLYQSFGGHRNSPSGK